jgi:hypothetical protein
MASCIIDEILSAGLLRPCTYFDFCQVMATRPRSDIYVNLPALEKLDDMLLVIRSNINFCYYVPVRCGSMTSKAYCLL